MHGLWYPWWEDVNRKGGSMNTDEKKLKVETAALEAEVEGLMASYIQLLGWKPLFVLLSRLAEKRNEGRIGGIMQAAVGFLSEKG
jgi:hypothetical protein